MKKEKPIISNTRKRKIETLQNRLCDLAKQIRKETTVAIIALVKTLGKNGTLLLFDYHREDCDRDHTMVIVETNRCTGDVGAEEVDRIEVTDDEFKVTTNSGYTHSSWMSSDELLNLYHELIDINEDSKDETWPFTIKDGEVVLKEDTENQAA